MAHQATAVVKCQTPIVLHVQGSCPLVGWRKLDLRCWPNILCLSQSCHSSSHLVFKWLNGVI